MYKHLNPKPSKPLNFWSTTWHFVWVINEVGLSRCSAFGRQLTAYLSTHWFWIYSARHPHLSSSSSFSAISMTYHKQFSISEPCAPALWRELCSWMHDRMHHDSRNSFSFASGFDGCINYSYDITDLYFATEFRLWFSLNCLTYQEQAERCHVQWLSGKGMWSLEHWHAISDPCSCIDELSCLTIWSLKSSNSWYIAK